MGSRGRKASFDQRPKMLRGEGGGWEGGRLPTREKRCCETQEEGVFKLTAGPSTMKKHLPLCYSRSLRVFLFLDIMKDCKYFWTSVLQNSAKWTVMSVLFSELFSFHSNLKQY